MNGESSSVPQVPVTTLAGTVSLTELLPELPLPSPVEEVQSRSLLFHPRVAEEAQRHLACHDSSLVAQLAQALASTSADHIELKEQFDSSSSPIDLKSAPPLLKGILKCNAAVFADSGAAGVRPKQESVSPRRGSQRLSNHVNDISPSIKKEPVDAKPIGKGGLKEPLLKLVKLSPQELENFKPVASPKTTPGAEAVKENHTSARKSRSSRGARQSKYKDSGSGDEVNGESSEEDTKKPIKYFKSREKEREEKKRRDKAEKKRKRADSDDEYNPEADSNKRCKGGPESEDDEDVDKSVGSGPRNKQQPAPQITPKKQQYNRKKLERKLESRLAGEKLSNEELMETGVYQRFTRLVEKIFDNTEDIDINAEIEEDGDVPQEFLIPKYELAELCSETAKLKSLGATSLVPPERVVRLLNILEKNIRDGAKVTPIMDEDDEDEEKLWIELVMERILRGMDASLTVLYIMTAPNMSKRIYLEDVIERSVQFVKFQLTNTIYPSFDPVYRIDNKKDGFIGNFKRQRAHMKNVRDRNILGLYNKLHEVVGLIADLLSIQTLTDTAVLFLSSLGVAPFFVENVPELQLSSLRLVTKIFSKYEKHRRLLLDDILASIARLPSSKRNLRSYRLNAEENIQMLAALVLQLIQCVVDLPDSLAGQDSKNKQAETKNTPGKSNNVNNNNNNSKTGSKEAPGGAEAVAVDRDVLVAHRYEMAMQTAYSFLSVFLEKTGSKSEEIDYRPLFENFVQDLLLTVNKPEWPAAELLLSFLGKLLVQKFSNKNTEMSLRVSSLDCLGIVAARLRRDAVSSQLKVNQIDQIIQEVKDEESKDIPFAEGATSPAAPVENGPSSNRKSKKKKGNEKSETQENAVIDEVPKDEEEERTLFLRKVLLDWLAVNSESDTALLHARHFYIGQWYRDAFAEISRQKCGPMSPRVISRKSSMHKKRRRRRKGESSEEESSESEDLPDDDDVNGADGLMDESTKAEVIKLSERRKMILLGKVAPFPPAAPGSRTQTLRTFIDYESAELIARYLASKRSFSQSFDNYLKQILRVLSESAIAVRTKAMKCLTMVVDADPAVLGRSDMQLGVHHSFLDHSTSVREAAVDLVGKFVLLRPELIHKYYEMIAARILDTGVSVRKRVIKIMKDICLEYPDFQKIPEICVKMIRRVNDEEGIKKLVQEVFQVMWFTPVREKPHLDKEALLVKVNNIAEVVISCKDTGLEWFEQFLQSMFRPKEDKEDSTKVHTEPPKSLVTACKQIVDCLVNHILVLEETGFKSDPGTPNHSLSNKGFQTPNGEADPQPRSASVRLVACLRTIHLFAKIRPQLVINHAYTLQPYLALKCQTQGDYTVIGTVARTLELVVPLMEHPSENFLSQLEEDAVKLILLHDRSVVSSCLALLGSIVNTVTKNYRLIKDCFQKYYSFLADYKRLEEENPTDAKLGKSKPFLRRALYTVGLVLRHFNLNNSDVRCGLPVDITEDVVETLMYFVKFSDFSIQFGSLQSIGSVCIRHYDLMLTKRVKELYHHILCDSEVHVQLKVQILVNLESYLQEEEIRMIKQDQEWAKLKTKENLKEMCDVQSGMASTIIQQYLLQVLESIIASNVSIRHTALRVIQLVLLQGLVHPIQIIPYLIAMSTDSEEMISHSADKQLQENEKKYPGFVNMKAMQGFRLSFRLQKLTQPDTQTRGLRQKKGEYPGAMNGFLYSIMRGTKNQRRALAMSLLKQFDEHARVPLTDLLYIADNLAYFPYQVIDEPMFIIHHIDIMMSVTGSNLLQSFREALLPPPNAELKVDPATGQAVYIEDEDDDDVTEEAILSRMPSDPTPLVDCMNACQGCLLMLILKEHLKDIYGITDGKICHYSPSDTTKQYEKSLSRKSSSKFNPKRTLQRLSEVNATAVPNGPGPIEMTHDQKLKLVNEYFDFKDLMLKIDREEDVDSDSEVKGRTPNHVILPDGRLATRSQRLQHQANNKTQDSMLLPGTDKWNDAGEEHRPAKESPEEKSATTETRSPIKPITIRTSQITSSPHRHHKHKKHKKKKKRKRIIRSDDEDEEESEFSDPDFVLA